MSFQAKPTNNRALCGSIFLTLDNLTSTGKIIINCELCEDEFKGFSEYEKHLAEHYPQIHLQVDLEKNQASIKQENMLFTRTDGISNSKNEDSTFELINNLLNKNEMQTSLSEIQKLILKDTDLETEKLLHDNSTNNNYSDLLNTNNSFKQCPHCEKKFHLLSSLKCHLIKHSNNFIYKCDLCNLEFEHKLALGTHMKRHKKKKENKNQLKKIELNKRKTLKVCNARKCVKKEIFTNTITQANIQIPNFCNDRSLNTETENLSEELLLQNFEKANEILNSTTIDCIERNDVPSTTGLEEQELQNSDFKYCLICNKAFDKRKLYFNASFNAHMTRHRACQFKCTMCPKEFKTRGELQTHTRFHTGEKIYLCSICGESFFTASKLCNHSRRHHTKERKKECNICEKKFYALGELKTHIKSVHTSERPYHCKLCPSTFNRPFSLQTHMKSHENKREHKCNLCSASFNQKCNLTAHKKKTHFLVTESNE